MEYKDVHIWRFIGLFIFTIKFDIATIDGLLKVFPVFFKKEESFWG